MKYLNRFQPRFEECKKFPTVNQRVKYCLSKREGEYLIKAAKNGPHYCGQSNLYLCIGTFLYGLEFGRRKSAAWFKKEELTEVIARLNNLKGFQLVKR